jgi:hypothetical protein
MEVSRKLHASATLSHGGGSFWCFILKPTLNPQLVVNTIMGIKLTKE